MFKDLIKNYDEFKIISNSKEYKNKIIEEYFFKTLEGSYFSPSYIYADNDIIKSELKKGIWIELNFKETLQFNNYSFLKLLIPIKPKCDWLTFYRTNDKIYDGKCINLNLATKTTDLYNIIKENLNEE